MADRVPQRDARAGDEPFGRPLPDGGLAESMPDWLRRPPAWRDTTTDQSYLPPPDTSPIDPGTLIDVDDLSPWLQRIARRSEQQPAVATPVEHQRAASRSRTIPIVDPHRLPRGSAGANEEANSSLPPHHQLHAGAGGSTQQRRWPCLTQLLLILVMVVVVGVVVFAGTS